METRRKEAAAAARILGVAHRENLGLPDAHLEMRMEYKLAIAAANPGAAAAHGDPALLGGPASRPLHGCAAGLRGLLPGGTETAGAAGEAYRPFKILYSTTYDRSVRPSFVVDISSEFSRRTRAILAYGSQFQPIGRERKSKVYIPLDRLVQEVHLVARFYGDMVGVEYAEPFLTKEVMQVEDVVELPVRSV